MPAPHKPTVLTLVIFVILIMIAYHFTLGRRK